MHSQMEKITRMEFYSKFIFTPLKTLDQGTLTKHRQALFRSMGTSSGLQISCLKLIDFYMVP